MHLSGKSSIDYDSLKVEHKGAGMFVISFCADGDVVASIDPMFMGDGLVITFLGASGTIQMVRS